MHSLAIPCLAMSAINAYLGVYHLMMALRRPQAREQLPFALLCFVVAAYEAFCVGLYSATSIEQGVFWQRLQLQTVPLIAIMTFWFVGRLVGTSHRMVMRAFVGWYVLMAAFSLLPISDLTVSVNTPSLKYITWGHRPLITYYESDVGGIFVLVMISGFVGYAYMVYVLVRHYRRQPSRHVFSILIGNLAYFLGMTCDSLVTAKVYTFIYISEYMFLVLTLSMAYVLLNQFVDLHARSEALNVDLERAVAQRTTELRRSLAQQSAMQEQLVEASRRSGMADVATDVLHNVGNALNSVNVSVDLMEAAVRTSRVTGLSKVVRMIREHGSDLAGFFAADARGQRVPEYLTASTDRLEQERDSFARELASLRTHVDHIKLVVATQQSHAGAPAVRKPSSLASALDDALSAGLARHDQIGIELLRDYQPMQDVDLDRHKLLQIMSSLLDNAWSALEGATAAGKCIRVRLRPLGTDQVEIAVEDNGCGIPPENLSRIFNHGFTTRRKHNGFGLHASACAAGEMGGNLRADSDGAGRGARFTLVLPLRVPGPLGTGRLQAVTDPPARWLEPSSRR